jgi:hypothetical protein
MIRHIVTGLLLLASRAGGDPEKLQKNLVLGTQKGVLPHEFRVFIASLRSTACIAQVSVIPSR